MSGRRARRQRRTGHAVPKYVEIVLYAPEAVTLAPALLPKPVEIDRDPATGALVYRYLANGARACMGRIGYGPPASHPFPSPRPR